MGYVGMDNILGQAEAQLAASNTPTADDSNSSMGQDDFLTLLVAQLTNQDPLNPMEDTDITGQLAQFSSLEQLTNLNTGLDKVIDKLDNSDMLSAVNYLGRYVKADGYTLSKSGTDVSSLFYSLGEPVANVSVYIYSSDGDIVRTDLLGSKQAGEFTYQWDGKDEEGNDLPDGLYSVGILGEDADGSQVMVSTQVAGLVEGVTSENGSQYLRLTDGRYINFLNVYEVVSSAGETTTTTE